MPIIFILTKPPPRSCVWVNQLKKDSLIITIFDKLAHTMQMGTLSLLGVGVKKRKMNFIYFQVKCTFASNPSE